MIHKKAEAHVFTAGASLHVCMTPHGPDTATFESAIAKDSTRPEHLPADALAFMFEARLPTFSTNTLCHFRALPATCDTAGCHLDSSLL